MPAPLIWGLFGLGAALWGGSELVDSMKSPAFDPVSPNDDLNSQVSQAAILVGFGAMAYYVIKG